MNLNETAFEHLEQRLLEGALAPGQKLSLRSLAAELQMSTAPVREAVGRLAALGALEVTPKKAIMVPKLSPEQYLELVEVRALLEGHAAARAAPRITPVRLREATAAHQRLLSLARQGNLDGCLRQNQRFHFLIYEAARSGALLDSIAGIWLRVGPSISHVLKWRLHDGRASLAQIFDNHEVLLSALGKGDPDAALRAVVADIESSRDHLLAGLSDDTAETNLRLVAYRSGRSSP